MKPEVSKHIGRTLWAKLDVSGAQVSGELESLLARLERAERRSGEPRGRDAEPPAAKRPHTRDRAS